MRKSESGKQDIRAFWQLTGITLALVTLWGLSIFWPEALETIIGVSAVAATVLWGVALLDRASKWLGWRY